MEHRVGSISIRHEALKAFIQDAYVSIGMGAEDAEVVAGLMADADLQGSDGHGVIRLPGYVKRIRAGGMNLNPSIRIVRETSATAVIDGDNGPGHLVMSRATQVAMAKAREAGVGWVGARNSNHAGPASLYARKPLAHGMISLYFAVGNANHTAPWGGSELLLSTNPIAIGIPGGDEPDVVLDMATTVASYGKVKARAKQGKPLPEGWMVDRAGQPVLDPAHSAEGFLLPIGGYKGYGLALAVGILAGTLNGAAMGRDVVDFNREFAAPTNTGQAIIVVDLNAFGDPSAFRGAIDALCRDLKHSQRLPGVDRIWVPGEQSHEKRQRHAEQGIPVVPALLQELDALAQDLGIATLSSRLRA